MHPAKMSGQELRFLRAEMGLTQAQLAEIVKVSLLTVSRWERNETPVNDAAEMLVRCIQSRSWGSMSIWMSNPCREGHGGGRAAGDQDRR